MVKEQLAELLEQVEPPREDRLHTQAVPTPTAEYRSLRKLMRAATAPATPPQPQPIPNPLPPIPLPLLKGPRVLLWKQDPSVAEIGIRKAFLPRPVSTGPRDGRIKITGLTPVSPNAMGDFIQTPLTPEFDAVHTFAVVRQTLTMYQRALANSNVPAPLPWRWNTANNTEPIETAPHHSQMMNAFYHPGLQLLAFGFFPRPGAPPGSPMVFTCRSLDIVAHETGHAILDGLQPQWILANNVPQTGALHESFGDLTAIFLALSQFDQVEAIIAQTKANLHDKTFLSDMAEEFGLALGRPNGLRNADNDLKLSDVSNEVHSLSQVFTGAIYDVLADLFALERRPTLKDEAGVLYQVAEYLRSLVLRAIIAAPADNATFTDVANHMLNISAADGKPNSYRNSIRNRFTLREVVVSPVPLAETEKVRAALLEDVPANAVLKARPHIADDLPQNREGCCGTMTLPENMGVDAEIEREKEEFLKQLKAEIQERRKAVKETR